MHTYIYIRVAADDGKKDVKSSLQTNYTVIASLVFWNFCAFSILQGFKTAHISLGENCRTMQTIQCDVVSLKSEGKVWKQVEFIEA